MTALLRAAARWGRAGLIVRGGRIVLLWAPPRPSRRPWLPTDPPEAA